MAPTRVASPHAPCAGSSLAPRRNCVLHTAYNWRHDPAINETMPYELQAGKVLGATLVSRDYPYPPAHYLETSGNLFKDCVVPAHVGRLPFM